MLTASMQYTSHEADTCCQMPGSSLLTGERWTDFLDLEQYIDTVNGTLRYEPTTSIPELRIARLRLPGRKMMARKKTEHESSYTVLTKLVRLFVSVSRAVPHVGQRQHAGVLMHASYKKANTMQRLAGRSNWKLSLRLCLQQW